MSKLAVKATPNPHILKILHEEGFGADCSSLAELVLCERCGIVGHDIMFTSNNTPSEEFRKARELGAIINLDDISHLPFLKECAGLPELLCFSTIRGIPFRQLHNRRTQRGQVRIDSRSAYRGVRLPVTGA